MKKLIVLLLILGLCAAPAIARAETTIKVGATPVPHAEILNEIKPLLQEKGITLEVIEFTDYVQPNLQLADGEIDANFFQHIPYLEAFSADHNLDLTYIARVHIEPMGVYSSYLNDLAELPAGAQVAIPNDVTNSGRALLLLEQGGLIVLDTDDLPTPRDISDNPLGIRVIELEAASLPRTLVDVDIAVINTNYALEAGLDPINDALFIEDAQSPYVNVLAVRSGDKNKEALLQLATILNGEEVREFIKENYGQSIVPAF